MSIPAPPPDDEQAELGSSYELLFQTWVLLVLVVICFALVELPAAVPVEVIAAPRAGRSRASQAANGIRLLLGHFGREVPQPEPGAIVPVASRAWPGSAGSGLNADDRPAVCHAFTTLPVCVSNTASVRFPVGCPRSAVAALTHRWSFLRFRLGLAVHDHGHEQPPVSREGIRPLQTMPTRRPPTLRAPASASPVAAFTTMAVRPGPSARAITSDRPSENTKLGRARSFARRVASRGTTATWKTAGSPSRPRR